MKKLLSKVLLFMTVFILFYITLIGSNSLAQKKYEQESKVNIIDVNSTSEEQELSLDENDDNNNNKIAYITIDDGPSKYTNQILDILDRHDVKATFFMINNNMKIYEKALSRAVEEGHSIGFHSVSHDVDLLYKSVDTAVGEFNTCRETFHNLTGKDSKLIRLPYGSKPYTTEEAYNGLKSEGYLIWDWNVDSQDWKGTKDKIVSNILYHGRDKETLVLLIHEKEQTVQSLERIIKILKERGYTILPIKEDNEALNFWEKNLF